MRNESGVAPLGRAVLVKQWELQKSGAILIPEEVAAKQAAVDQRVIVVEAGPEAWLEEKAPRATPGDQVLVTKFAGMIVIGPADKQVYRLVNDRDIFCKITHTGE